MVRAKHPRAKTLLPNVVVNWSVNHLIIFIGGYVHPE